ncbi:MAG TPA: GntR family transcriptional regulator [Acidimicrobiia bacterium]|nr:GntR family transcriptional regulator [Acidimicrobiia bacterium]
MARDVRYRTLAAELRRAIATGGYPPGQLLPSEAELAAAHAVSRVTVRKALGQLKAEGLVDSRQGFGWYAIAVPLRQSLSELTTIEAQVRAAGLTPRRRVLGFAFVDAPPRAAQVLGVATVLEIARLNLADDRPFARVTVWVPEQLAADLSRRAVEHQPLYELLGIPLGGATQAITAVAATPDDAALLNLPAGSPLLRCERITADRGGRPVLLSDAVFHPLVTEFVAELPALDHVEPTGLRLIR